MNAPKRILITGAATGIGRATAERFLRDGWVVGAYDIDTTELESFAEQDTTGRLLTGHLDVSDPAEWTTCLGEFAPDGRLEVLVNNAGVLAAGQFEEISLERHRAIIEVNVLGTIYGAHAAHPLLANTRGSMMVNMCSASAIYGQPGLATYSTSKFAVRGLSEALELEWRAQDITVVALWPLFVATPMVAGVETGTTRALGVHLTSQDIADAVAETVKKGRSLLPKVHHPVGRQAKVFATAAQFSPAWANRLLNKVLSGS